MKRVKIAAKSIFGRTTKSPKSDEAGESSLVESIIASSVGTPIPPQATDPEVIPIHLASQIVPTQAGMSSDPAIATGSSPGRTTDSAIEEPRTISLMQTSIESTKATSELDKAIDEFEKHYKQFSQRYILIGEDLECTFQSPPKWQRDDLKRTAKLFGDNVMTTIKAMEKKQNITQGKWTNQVGQFLTKLYPLARLGCGLTGAVAEMLEEESDRREDFLYHLKRIEFQTALIADNPSYDLDLEATQNLLKEKSTDLMTAVITFLNSALVYLSDGFLVNLSKSALKGPQAYAEGIRKLDAAIREYDQSVMHLVAQVVSSIFLSCTILMTGMKYEKSKEHNEEFLEWLSPSYWQVESLLSSFRQQRSEGTLQWACNMPEFQAWRLSELHENAERRITWINGTLGMGKSIMAGYFIDLLKVQYPGAIVAYFFCRSNQPGLTNARDILRTLAYQCVEKDKEARKVLEYMKSKRFQLKDNLGIQYLFEKLLLDPLRNSSEIFIVLDGLDEADMVTPDHTDRTGTPELHVLLTCLAKLPSTRLLCISRPSAKISDVIRNTFSKPIGKFDNAVDIDSYVQKTVSESEMLKAQFKAAYADPLQYFRNRGSGIFLWIVLALRQLGKAKSRSDFQKYLDNYSAASGSMEALYSSILSRIAEEDKRWVKEILRWLVACVTSRSVEGLKNLVEWSLQDELVIDFREFLERNCGSIIQLTPTENLFPVENTPYLHEVELIHETFRSFIVNQTTCPQAFYIDVPQTNGYIALKCLESLKYGRHALRYYYIPFWIHHLLQAKSEQQTCELLVAVYQLFTSDGLEVWVNEFCNRYTGVKSRQDILRHNRCELSSVWTIREWMRGCSMNRDNVDAEAQAANDWRRMVLQDAYFLGEAIGKAAGRLWLYQKNDDRTTLQCFSLALKYYWRRSIRSRSDAEELQDLIDSAFLGISDWAEHPERKKPVVQRNLGLAFFVFSRWDDCVRCLTNDGFPNEMDWLHFGKYLVYAYIYKREHDRAIALMDKHCRSAFSLVMKAYETKDDYERAIKRLEAELNREPSWICFRPLQTAYEMKGDHTMAITHLENGLGDSQYPERVHESMSNLMYSVCKRKGGFAAAFTALQTAVEKYPEKHYTWLNLAYAYRDNGDQEGAINTLQLGFNTTPHDDLFHELLKLHVDNGNYDEAINVVRTSFKFPFRPFINKQNIGTLIVAYNAKDDLDGLIQELEALLKTSHPIYDCLIDVLIEKKNYDEAIKVVKTAMVDSSIPTSSFIQRLFELYMAKGDHDEAIRVLETGNKFLRPYNQRLLAKILKAYETTGNHDGAVMFFQAITEQLDWQYNKWVWPALMRAWTMNAGLDYAMQNFEAAVTDFEIEPTPELCFTILDLYATKGDGDGAVRTFTMIVDLWPLENWSWHTLAEAYKMKRDYSSAIATYHSALQYISTDYLFHKCLCDLYSISDPAKALEHYDCIKVTAPESFLWKYVPLAHLVHGRISEPGTVDESLRASFLWYSVGVAYKAVGEDLKAHEIYDTVILQYQLAVKQKSNDLAMLYVGMNSMTPLDEMGPVAWDLGLLCLWAVLGEAYEAKGDIEAAYEWFQKASMLEPKNEWLCSRVLQIESEIKLWEKT